MVALCLSGYRDSNSGPPTPEAGALTGLRYIPIAFVKHRKDNKLSVEQKFSLQNLSNPANTYYI